MRTLAPPTKAIAEIRAHLEDVHGWTEFDPERDVAFPDNTPDGACVAYLPATTVARGRFICSCCNGGIYIEGQSRQDHPAGTAEILHPHPLLGVVQRHGAHDASALALLVREWSGHRLGQA
jgi:hypothetical protein